MNRSVLKVYCSLLFALLLAVTLQLPEALAQRARISSKDRNLVISKLEELKNPVTVYLYTGGGNKGKTRRTSELLEFMEESSENIKVIRHDLDEEKALQKDLGVDHGPVMALKGVTFQGHSYYGLPSQMELEPFLDGILIAGGQGKRLSPQAARFLSELDKEVHIRVFVTPD